MNDWTSPVDIRPDHLEMVQDILREHLPAGIKVWVFGSRANWTTKDSSDLDLAVEGASILDYRAMVGLEVAFEESDLPYTVDVVDLNDVSSSFKQIMEGQRVLLPNGTLSNKDWLYHPPFPEHWDRRPLYSLAEWVNGLAFRNIQFSPTGMPVIKIAEIKGGISGQTKFTEQQFYESVLIRPGDLLFSWSGQPETSIDAFWWRGPKGWLNQHVFRVTPDACVDSTFFYYILRYLKPNFVGIARNKQTTGLGHVTRRDLESIEVALPPLPEQRAIAHILGTLDDKIELNRRLDRTLEEMARAVFQDWFVDFGPTRAKLEGREPYLPPEMWDLFPNRLVDSELGEIPEGWEVGNIGDVADERREGLTPEQIDPNTPYIGLDHMPRKCIALSEWGKAEGLASGKFKFKERDILFGKLRPYFHKVGFAPLDGVCSTDIVVASPKSKDWFGFMLSPNPPMLRGLGVGTRGEGHGSGTVRARFQQMGPVAVGSCRSGRQWRTTAAALGETGGTACSRRPSRTGLARVCGDLRLAG